jgi:hypothetical protein
MSGVIDHHVEGAPINATKAGCDCPALVDGNAIGDLATGKHSEKLTGIFRPTLLICKTVKPMTNTNTDFPAPAGDSGRRRRDPRSHAVRAVLGLRP